MLAHLVSEPVFTVLPQDVDFQVSAWQHRQRRNHTSPSGLPAVHVETPLAFKRGKMSPPPAAASPAAKLAVSVWTDQLAEANPKEAKAELEQSVQGIVALLPDGSLEGTTP